MSESPNTVVNPASVLAGFAIQFGIAIAMCVACIGVFEIVRKRHEWIFAPKYFSNNYVPIKFAKSKKNKKKGKGDEKMTEPCSLYNPGKTMFSWIRPSLSTSSSTVAAFAGLDALMFTEFLKFGLKFFALLLLPSAFILVSSSLSLQSSILGFDIHGSIPDSHPILTLIAITSSVTVATACILLWKLSKKYAKTRAKYMDFRRDTPQLKTLLITDVPDSLRDEAMLRKSFDAIFSKICGSDKLFKSKDFSIVDCVCFDRDVSQLKEVLDKHEKSITELEEILVAFVESSNLEDESGARREVKGLVSNFRKWRVEKQVAKKVKKVTDIVDSQNHVLGQNIPMENLLKIQKRLDAFLDDEKHNKKSRLMSLISNHDMTLRERIEDVVRLGATIEELRGKFAIDLNSSEESHKDHHQGSAHKNSQGKEVTHSYSNSNEVVPAKDTFIRKSSVFVTLKTPFAAGIFISQGRLPVNTGQSFSCLISPAPQQEEIIWDNISSTFAEKVSRKYVVRILVGLLVVFYILPVMAIVGLTSIDSLETIFPGVGAWRSIVWINSLIQNVVPAMLITGAMNFLQMLLRWMSASEKPNSVSELDKGVMMKYFYFQLFNVLFAFAIGSSLVGMVNQLVEDPREAFLVIASTLSQNAPFFVNYVILGTSLFSMELLQCTRIFFLLFEQWTTSAQTPRVVYKFKNTPVYFNYGQWYPVACLVFVIGTIFSVIYPVITVFVTAYFGFAFVIFRYQLLYVYTPRYETFGRYFKFAVSKIFLGLYLQQLTLLGFFALKKAPTPALFVTLPTIIVTMVLQGMYKRVFEHSNHSWEALTHGDEVKTVEVTDEKRLEVKEDNAYVNPILHGYLQNLWLPVETKECLSHFIEKSFSNQ